MSFAPAAPSPVLPPRWSPGALRWGLATVISLAVSPGGFWRRAAGRARSASDGFSEVVLIHLDAAYSLARYLARDAEAAEDIVQEAVLKAHRAFAGFRGGEAKAWLLTIVRREFLDWAAARRAGRTVFAEPAEAEPPSEDATPEEALAAKDETGRVRQAIEALPEPFREAIVLRELEEMSYREVAQVTGAPIGTVMSRLARGRELLARRLAPEAPR